ncbi:Dual specificity protein phosphatase 3 [Tyrophagus putrescentiae]|nr:Dual specificity protein phosphatase 3 [Tyrophagus putrescentiae]
MSSSMLWRRWPSPSVTPNELLEILTAHTAGYYVLPAEPNNEVFPGVYLGDSTTALCLHLLRQIGITHVLNAACGKNRNYGMALDVAVYPLFQHFTAAAEFIEEALSSAGGGGRVLVHCGEGISRSSTLVIAWLMLKRGYPLKEAVRQVVKHRNILPNQGFLLQLCQLADQIVAGTVPQPQQKKAVEKTVAPISRGSSVSPMPDRQSSHRFLSPSPSPSLFTSPLQLLQLFLRLLFAVASACVFLFFSWSNGWTPPPPPPPPPISSSSSSSFASSSYSRARSPSPSRRSYLFNGSSSSSPSPTFSLYGSAAKRSTYSPVFNSSSSSSSTYLSPLLTSTTRPSNSRGLRCQSVDRDFGGSGGYSRPLYSSGSSNLLLSSYLSPRHYTAIR